MEHLIGLLPHDELFYAILGVFLPSIIGVLAYVKAQKDELLDKLAQSRLHIAQALDYTEDGIEGLLENLSPESEGGHKLTEDEKKESLQMAARALSELKKVKGVILGE